MGFFDYKFMILLGLTLVIYFIYREIELLHSRINKLEDDVKNLDIKLLTNSVTETLNKLESQPVKQIEPEKPQVSVPKVINLELNNSLDIPKSKDSGIKMVTPLSINKKLSDIPSESEQTTTDYSTSSTSKHLAIYSNDNEQFVETQNSLLESIEAHKNDLDFDYGKMEGPNENVNDLIDLIKSDEHNSSESSSEQSTSKKDLEIDEIIAEKDRQLSEMSSSSKKSSTKKYDANTLEKTKLPELKKIAKELNISLSKKQNNSTIPKTKLELIQEILNLEPK